MQMTKANTQACNKFHSPVIFTIKNIIGGWSDKFQDFRILCLKALMLPRFHFFFNILTLLTLEVKIE